MSFLKRWTSSVVVVCKSLKRRRSCVCSCPAGFLGLERNFCTLFSVAREWRKNSISKADGFEIKSMEGSLHYERVNKVADSQRGSWMPSRRRDRIKKKLVAGCLAAIAAFCCFGSRTGAAGPEVKDEQAMAKESFANQGL